MGNSKSQKGNLDDRSFKEQELEDRHWLMQADLARKEGFVTTERIDAILATLEDSKVLKSYLHR